MMLKDCVEQKKINEMMNPKYKGLEETDLPNVNKNKLDTTNDV